MAVADLPCMHAIGIGIGFGILVFWCLYWFWYFGIGMSSDTYIGILMVVAHFPDLILIPISPHGIQLRLTVSKQQVTACQCSTFNISRSNFATIESHSTNWKLQDIQKTSSVLRSQSQFRSRRWNFIPFGWTSSQARF